MVRSEMFSLAWSTDLESVRGHIEAFGAWLRSEDSNWTVRPPVSIYSRDGHESFAFVVLRNDQVFGVFTSPMHALMKMGDHELAHRFQRYMRDRRQLGYPRDLLATTNRKTSIS